MKFRENYDGDKYAEIKVTTGTYCQACGNAFEGTEIVFFVPLDNNIICKECAVAHTVAEPRLFIEGEY